MAVWKAIFDAKHDRGRYYGRVAFVVAEDEASARQAATVEALTEFPAHGIELIGIGVSTDAAMDNFRRQRQVTKDWQAQNRAKQVLLCKACNGTGRA